MKDILDAQMKKELGRNAHSEANVIRAQYAEMQKEWKESVTDRIYKFRLNEVGIKLPEDDSFVAYVTDPMETWAHMQTEYFSKIYDGYRGDEIMSFEKVLNEAEGDFKSLNIGGNRVLSPLIYNPNDK